MKAPSKENANYELGCLFCNRQVSSFAAAVDIVAERLCIKNQKILSMAVTPEAALHHWECVMIVQL